MRFHCIIKDLMNSSDYLNIDYFMKKYNVSKRTLQNDITYLMRISSDKGFKIQQKRGIGYLLEIVDERKFNDFSKSLNQEEFLDSKERIYNIFAYLLIQNGFVTMEQVAEKFDVSKSLIKKDIKEVEEIANTHDFSLKAKAHYGIYLEVSAESKKLTLIKLLFSENKMVVGELSEVVADKTYKKIENRLVNEFKINDLNINYNELKNITVWLLVTIYLNIKLETPISKIHNDESIYIKISNSVLDIIAEVYNIGLKKSEIIEFIELIKANTRVKEPEISLTNNLATDIDDFLEKIDKEYQKGFNKDEKFKQLLLTHVALLIERVHQKNSYKNTLIDEICIKYPMTFNMAIKFCEMLSANYHVETTKDEIGFLATYFAFHMEKESNFKLNLFSRIAVVCSSGGGSAYMIKMKLETLFEQANIRAFSFVDISDIEDFKPDLIFTIKELDLNLSINVPVIYIKELLDDMDILRIKQVIRFDKFDKFSLLEDKNSFYASLYQKEYFQIIDEILQYETILEKMSKKIEEDGYGGEHYSEYVLQRESYLSTIYLNGIALPHPIDMCSNKNLISVAILKNPCIHDGKKVRIVFMISLTKDGYEILKDISKRLYEIMNNDKLVDELYSANSYEQFIAILNTQ